MKITNKTNLPDPVVRTLTADTYSRGDSNRSITQLIDSPRIRILMAEHDNDITIDVSEMLWTALGKAVHYMFEHHTVTNWLNSKPEERLEACVDDWLISGAIDLQHTAADGGLLLSDYKSTSIWSVIYGKKEWDYQLNSYAWLVETAKHVKVSGLQVIALLRDWKQRDADTKGADYPSAPIVVVPIPLWSAEQRDAYLRERVRLHQDAEFLRLTGDKLPLCTDAERWVRPPTFAVMKGKNKRALRVFSSIEDAEAYLVSNPAPELSIQKRTGEAVRCSTYCRVAEFCDQWQEELKRVEATDSSVP